MNSRGQASIELLILVGFLLAGFVIFMIVINENLSGKINDRENFEINEIALIVRNEIDLAHSSIDGYRREFILPDKTFYGDYDISLIEGAVFVQSSDGKHAVSLLVKNATGELLKSKNIIRRLDGVVTID